MTGRTEPQPFGRALRWLLLVTAVFHLNFLARTIISPLMPVVEADLSISHGQAGGLYFFISLGYSLTLLLSSYVNSRLRHRECIALASVVMGSALVSLTWAEPLWAIQGALFLFGMGGGIYLPSGIAAITSLTVQRDWGRALAVHELAPTLAFILSPLLAEAMLQFMGWRTVFVCLGAASVLMGGVFAVWGRGGEFTGAPQDMSKTLQFLKTRNFWVLSAIFSLAIGASFGPYSVLPLFLTDERSLSLEQANLLLSVSRLPGPAIVFLAGWLVDRMGARRSLVLFCGLSAVTTALLGLTSGPFLVAAVLCQPMITACFFPAAFAVISRLYPESMRPMVVGLTTPVGIVGGSGLAPAMLGMMGESGGFWLGFILLGGILAAGMFLVRTLDEAV